MLRTSPLSTATSTSTPDTVGSDNIDPASCVPHRRRDPTQGSPRFAGEASTHIIPMGSRSESSSRKRRTEDSKSDSASDSPPPRMSSASHRHRSHRSHHRSSSPSSESEDRSERHRKKSSKEIQEYMAKKRRIEIMREMERDWRETERKRSAMVADSQWRVSEMIDGAFSGTKKARNPEE